MKVPDLEVGKRLFAGMAVPPAANLGNWSCRDQR